MPKCSLELRFIFIAGQCIQDISQLLKNKTTAPNGITYLSSKLPNPDLIKLQFQLSQKWNLKPVHQKSPLEH